MVSNPWSSVVCTKAKICSWVNETNPDGVGFCCYEVRVNGQLTADEVNSHAFEVDLRSQGIVFGQRLVGSIDAQTGLRTCAF